MSEQKYRRHIRNYLLDKKFQLTYAVTMVGISLLLSGLFGYMVYLQMRQSTDLYERQAKENLRSFREQSDEIIRTFEEQARQTQQVFDDQSHETKEVFASKTKEETELLNMLKQVPEFKDMAEQMLKKLQEDDQKTIRSFDERLKAKKKLLVEKLSRAKDRKKSQLAKTEAKMMEDKARRAAERARHNRKIIIGVVVFSILFILMLFLYAIVLTHKVAGPLFKISKYFEKMENGDFEEPTPLRKGDQLQGFYDRFKQMHGTVRERMKRELAVLEALERECEGSVGDSQLMSRLHSAVEELKHALHMDIEDSTVSNEKNSVGSELDDSESHGDENAETDSDEHED